MKNKKLKIKKIFIGVLLVLSGLLVRTNVSLASEIQFVQSSEDCRYLGESDCYMNPDYCEWENNKCIAKTEEPVKQAPKCLDKRGSCASSCSNGVWYEPGSSDCLDQFCCQTTTSGDLSENDSSCLSKNGNCLGTGECRADGGTSLGKLDCSKNKICCQTTTSGDLSENVSDDKSSSLIPDYPKNEDGSKIFKFEYSSVGDIFSDLLNYIYVIAGIILLVMLIMGGLGLMTAAGNPDKMKAGYGKITNALIGFLIVFVSYFVVQLVEAILGIKIM